jgi:hypothetical protein
MEPPIVRDLFVRIRQAPGMFLGHEGVDGIIKQIALASGHSFRGLLEVRLRSDGVIRVRFGDDEQVIGCFKGPGDPHEWPLRGDAPPVWGWRLAQACSVRAEARELPDGIELSFLPDYPSINLLIAPSPHRLAGWLADLATARPGLKVELFDEASQLQFAASFPRGAQDRLLYESGARDLNHPPLVFRGEGNQVSYDVAFAWAAGRGLEVVALVNGQRTAAGGAHVHGFWEGVADAINAEVASGGSSGKRCTKVGPFFFPRNCVLVISVELRDPTWGPGTNDCLHSRRARSVIRHEVAAGFMAALDSARTSPNPPWLMRSGPHSPEGAWLDAFRDVLRRRKRFRNRVDPYLHGPDEPYGDPDDE